MKTVNLVVFTGYPHSGKTTIANFLVEHGFVSIELNEIRKELFDEEFPKITEHSERISRLVFQYRKLDNLIKGKSVIMDTAAISNTDREENFLIPEFAAQILKNKKFKLKKYLLYIDVDRNLMKKRNMKDPNRNNKVFFRVLKTIDKYWQEPKSYKSKSVKRLTYKNNAKEDLEKIKISISKVLNL